MPARPTSIAFTVIPNAFRIILVIAAERFTPWPGIAEGFTTRSPQHPRARIVSHCNKLLICVWHDGCSDHRAPALNAVTPVRTGNVLDQRRSTP